MPDEVHRPSVRDMKTLHACRTSAALSLLLLLSTPLTARADDTQPPQRWERRSTALFVTGIVGVITSVPTTLVGAMALGFCANGGSFAPQHGECNLFAPMAVTVFGGGLLVGGILGIVYGSATVPAPAEETASLVPRLSMGPTSGSLTWRF
jgi:hypothetical protein